MRDKANSFERALVVSIVCPQLPALQSLEVTLPYTGKNVSHPTPGGMGEKKNRAMGFTSVSLWSLSFEGWDPPHPTKAPRRTRHLGLRCSGAPTPQRAARKPETA